MMNLTRRDWAVVAFFCALTIIVVLLALVAPLRWSIAMLAILICASVLLARAQLASRRNADQRLRRESRATREATKRILQVATRSLKQLDRTRLAASSAGEAIRVATTSESARTGAMRAELRGVRVSQQLLSLSMTSLRESIEEVSAWVRDASTKKDMDELTRMLSDIEHHREDASNESLRELKLALEGERPAMVRGITDSLHPSVSSLETELRRQYPSLITDLQALHQLIQRFEPRATLPPIAGWALSPSGLLALTDEIAERDADLVVECGSGTSTLWMAFAMRLKGNGRVIALEHSREYADKTSALLRAHGVADWAEVRFCPLAKVATPMGEFDWYDIDRSDWNGAIDLLLVDGPPTTTGRHARYPALPLLASALKPNAWIVVDDAERQDEQQVIELWREAWPQLDRVLSIGRGIEVLSSAHPLA